jgi:hypothetical protein
MKLLIAIMTCHRLDYYIDDLTVDWCTQQNLRCTDQQARVNTIRATWLTKLPEGVDYKFFYGTKLRDAKRNQRVPDKTLLREPLADEVFLDCGDQYTENPAKMKAICRWAIEHGYTHILRCDDDTFVYLDRLLATDWADFDYSGACATNDFHPGGCMFLSRRMMDLVISSSVTTYADDVWIGKVARDNRVVMHHIPSMRNQWGTGYKVPIDIDPTGISSFHSCTPDVMRRLHVASQA